MTMGSISECGLHAETAGDGRHGQAVASREKARRRSLSAYRHRQRKRQKGVTLVETLVALAVMGLVAGSVLALVAQNTRFAAAARDRTFAAVAADNIMVRELVLSGPIEIGERFGETEVAGREWAYRVTVIESGVDNIFRIDVDILDGEQAIANVVTLRRVQ